LAEQNVHSLRENPNNLAMELNEITYALRGAVFEVNKILEQRQSGKIEYRNP
jgi:hypothetical protein